MQTLTIINADLREIESRVPVLRCKECGDLFAYALFSCDSGHFDNLRMVGQTNDQKPRFCPGCGAKNKAGA